MFNDARRNATIDAFTRRLVRSEYKRAAEVEPSPAQYERGREAYEYYASSEDFRAAVAQAIGRIRPLRDDAEALGELTTITSAELHRRHAESGCRSLGAMATTIATRRAIDVWERMARRQRRETSLDAALTGPTRPRWVAGLTEPTGEDTDTAAIDMDDVVAYAAALTDRQCTLVRLMRGELTADERRVVGVDEVAARYLSDDQLAVLMTTDETKPKTVGSVQSMRCAIALEIGALLACDRVEGFRPDEAHIELAELIERWLDGDVLGDVTNKSVRGQARRLARFLTEREA
ncbi:MAG: hypothetical protein AAGC46_00360 [Solirubrobacteraceae bacterium]|nr:hypothetical protein [Patulibacter sp.]